MVHPAIVDLTITTGSGLSAYLKRNQGHQFAGSVGTYAAAAEIRAVLKSSADNWAGGRQATRIVKPLRDAAALQIDASRLYAVCYALFLEAYPPLDSRGTRHKFEPHK